MNYEHYPDDEHFNSEYVIHCKYCGYRNGVNRRTCYRCGKKLPNPKRRILKKWWFWVILAFAFVFLVSTCSEIIDAKPLTLKNYPEAEYRQKCATYTYEEVLRYPDKYSGELAVFTGSVIQVIGNGNNMKLLVSVNYGNVIYVYYTITNGINIIEGDIITMYGELRGTKTYTTVLNNESTVPRFYAKFIDIIG